MGGSNARVAIDSQVHDGRQKKWYVADMGKVLGPMSWYDIKGMADKAQVSPFAQIREETWPQWAPLTWYCRVKTRGDMEIEGLLPSRYDAIFWLGVFIFIFGVIAYIGQPIVGIILLIVSPIIEGSAIHLESKHKGKAITRTFGNVIAIFWMALQIFITVLLISTLLR